MKQRLARRILAVVLMAAAFGVAEAQQVQAVDSTEIPPVANQAVVDATPCGFGRDLNENQTLINLELFSVHWCDAISGTWEEVGSAAAGVPSTLIPFGTGSGLDSDPGFSFTGPPRSFNLNFASTGGSNRLLDIGNTNIGSLLTMNHDGRWRLDLQSGLLGQVWVISGGSESLIFFNPSEGRFVLDMRALTSSEIAINGRGAGRLSYKFQIESVDEWEVFYNASQQTGSLGTPDNIGLFSVVLFSGGEVEIAGCTQYEPLSGALPVGGAQCDEFYDIDVNRWCVFTTLWVQQDDYSTACVA